MALVITKKTAILLYSDNDSRIVIFEGKTITKSLLQISRIVQSSQRLQFPEMSRELRAMPSRIL